MSMITTTKEMARGGDYSDRGDRGDRGDRHDRQDRDDKDGEGRRGGFHRKKVCRFCADRVNRVDWKALHILRSFVTDRGKILSSRTTGTCAKHQRQLTIGIKRARTMALLPFLVTG